MTVSLPYDAEVRAYLADCAGLNPDQRWHPTADGAVKLTWHRGPDAAGQIRETFRAITASSAASSAAPSGPELEAGQ
jgi:hypothetical protein